MLFVRSDVFTSAICICTGKPPKIERNYSQVSQLGLDPWGRLKWPSTITRLTATLFVGWCHIWWSESIAKCMVIHDTKMSLLRPAVFKQHRYVMKIVPCIVLACESEDSLFATNRPSLVRWDFCDRGNHCRMLSCVNSHVHFESCNILLQTQVVTLLQGMEASLPIRHIILKKEVFTVRWLLKLQFVLLFSFVWVGFEVILSSVNCQ